jgi:hypothetical protein
MTKRFNGIPQRILINTIGRRTRSAPLKHRSNRDRQSVLRHILMNRVICETRQRFGRFIHVNFCFWDANLFGEPQNGLDDLLKFSLAQQFDRAGYFASVPARMRFSGGFH